MHRPALALIVLAGAVLVALLVVLIVVSVRRERARRERIRRWAAERGWSFAVRPTVHWDVRLPGYARRGVSLLVSGGVNGRPVSVAEYWYTTESSSTSSSGSGSSTSSTTHHLLVTAVRLDVAYPSLAVLPRGSLSRFGRTVFGDGAAATGHDGFDRQFRVQTKDPALARHLLGSALIGEHLAGRAPAWRLAGRDLLTWQTGRITDPDQITGLAVPLVRVAELLGR